MWVRSLICVWLEFNGASKQALTCAEQESSIRGRGPDKLLFSHFTYFTEIRTGLLREAIGPIWSNCFSRGVRTSIFVCFF